MFSVIFFDLGVIGVDLKRAFQFFGVLKKSRFWGVFGEQVLVLVFWKGCYRVDVLCGYMWGGDGFVLGFSFGVVENLEHRFWCFWGGDFVSYACFALPLTRVRGVFK